MHPLKVCLLFAALSAPAFAQSAEKQYLYVGRAPKDRDGFRDLDPSIEVHDINDHHRLVKVIPLPAGVKNIRGMSASAAAKKLWISHYGHDSRTDIGKVLCLDLVTNKVLWEKSMPMAVDRGAITPDGKRLYMPSGESVHSDYWYVLDGATGNEVARIHHASETHNTIVSLDGTRAFLQAFGSKYVALVDTSTNRILRDIGPFSDTPRPLTINGKATLLYQNVNDLIGFQVADVASGKVLYTAKPPSTYAQPAPTSNRVFSHGIAMRADEKEVWVVDQKHCGLHVFDVTGVPEDPPVWKKFIRTRSGTPEIYGQPGWIMSTIDGRYFYPETCEIVDTATKTIVGQLKGANGRLTHSRFAIEIDFLNGQPVRCGDQFGVGRVGANAAPTIRITQPADGASFPAPADITLAASAGDADGSIRKVEFFNGSTLIATENYSPYQVVWNDVKAGSYRLTARATDNQGRTSTSGAVDVTVSSGQSVVNFTLINADNDQPIAGHHPIANGATLNLSALPTRRLNIRANTSPSTVGSVRFGYDADADYRVESGAPYALASNAGADYHAWTPTTGSHTVKATPFTGPSATGGAGAAKTLTFTVVEGTREEGPIDTDEFPLGVATAEPAEAPSDSSGSGSACGLLGLELLLLLPLRRRPTNDPE